QRDAGESQLWGGGNCVIDRVPCRRQVAGRQIAETAQHVGVCGTVKTAAELADDVLDVAEALLRQVEIAEADPRRHFFWKYRKQFLKRPLGVAIACLGNIVVAERDTGIAAILHGLFPGARAAIDGASKDAQQALLCLTQVAKLAQQLAMPGAEFD